MNLSFRRPAAVDPTRFPQGSFSVNRLGEVVVSTVPRGFSTEKMQAIARVILSALGTAREMGTPLSEISADFAGLEVRARDLAGGAIIFLKPQEF